MLGVVSNYIGETEKNLAHIVRRLGPLRGSS
jgi:hypothetical protein